MNSEPLETVSDIVAPVDGAGERKRGNVFRGWLCTKMATPLSFRIQGPSRPKTTLSSTFKPRNDSDSEEEPDQLLSNFDRNTPKELVPPLPPSPSLSLTFHDTTVARNSLNNKSSPPSRTRIGGKRPRTNRRSATSPMRSDPCASIAPPRTGRRRRRAGWEREMSLILSPSSEDSPFANPSLLPHLFHNPELPTR